MHSSLTALHRVSSAMFYILGSIVILCAILLTREGTPSFIMTTVNILDLPFIAVSMAYGGSSFLLSLHEPPTSIVLFVAGFLSTLFAVFAYLNFAYPFQVIL